MASSHDMMHATICSEVAGDIDVGGGGGKLAVMWSMQSAVGRPSASMPAMTPAAAETIDVWQLKGLRTAPASAEKTFVVPATRDEPSTRGIPPAQCHQNLCSIKMLCFFRILKNLIPNRTKRKMVAC